MFISSQQSIIFSHVSHFNLHINWKVDTSSNSITTLQMRKQNIGKKPLAEAAGSLCTSPLELAGLCTVIRWLSKGSTCSCLLSVSLAAGSAGEWTHPGSSTSLRQELVDMPPAPSRLWRNNFKAYCTGSQSSLSGLSLSCHTSLHP